MEGHAEGRIKKIKIRDFMTYDYVELYPKKGLNLIVGLNGSGKSSIMCAISLGLAGKPNFTGRASHLSDFIKHGCQEAEIEIQLEKAKGSLVICRKIKRDKCEWFINHSTSNYNEVAKAVKCCNIDTSNLCQFLPQEKVTEFSRMDKKQRLENMLQTIGEPHLFQLFNELKELSKTHSEIQKNLKKSEVKKNSAEEENERISEDVKKQESRVRLKKELDDLFKKKRIVHYGDILNELSILKDKKTQLKSELVSLTKDLSQAVSSQQVIENSYRRYSTQKEEFKSQRNGVMKKITAASDTLRKLKEQAENENIEYKNRLIEVEEEKKRVDDLKELIEGLKQYLVEERDNIVKNEEHDKENSEKLCRLQQYLKSLYEDIEKVSAERRRIDYAYENCTNQLKELQNEHNKKMENLKRRDRDTYNAASWLQLNKNIFMGNIYMPILMEMKVQSTENCKYIENSIPFRDMIGFVCENENDYKKFSDIAMEKEWRINILLCPDTPLTGFTSPPLEDNCRNYGLKCYVSDLFTAPEPVLRYLYSCCGIHKVPVAFTSVSGKSEDYILKHYKSFFSGSFRIMGKISRYGNRNISKKKDYIIEKKLLTTYNNEIQNNITNELENLHKQKQAIEAQMKKLELKRIEAEKQQEVIRQEKKSYQELRNKFHKSQESYKQKVRSLNQICSINVEEEKQKVVRKINSINGEKVKTLIELNKLFKEFVHFEKEIIKVTFCMNSLSKTLKLVKSETDEINEKAKSIKEEHEKASAEYRNKKNYGKILHREIITAGEEYVKYLEAITKRGGDEACEGIPDLSFDRDDIEQKISHIQAQLSIDEDNEPLVVEYNARKQKIEEYQKEITSITSSIETLMEDIEEKRTEWLAALQRHIKNINKKFSHYFKLLNCAGEINLDIPDNQEDFANYGLQIKLKFRDEEPLTELSISRHSGGECSVAAIVFILSLQELTDVPFRCIDEINQGMDSVNERKIYQLIADSVGDDRCSQYFLLTPKLLPDLQYPEDVAVHIIFNSHFLNIKLDVKKHIKIYETL